MVLQPVSTESANAQLESEIVAQATEIKKLLTNQVRGTVLISRKTVGPIGTKLGRYVGGIPKLSPKIFGADPVSASGPKRATK